MDKISQKESNYLLVVQQAFDSEIERVYLQYRVSMLCKMKAPFTRSTYLNEVLLPITKRTFENRSLSYDDEAILPSDGVTFLKRALSILNKSFFSDEAKCMFECNIYGSFPPDMGHELEEIIHEFEIEDWVMKDIDRFVNEEEESKT